MSARSRAFPWWGERRWRPILDLDEAQRERERITFREIERDPFGAYSFLYDLNHWP